MRVRESNGDISVHAIAGSYVILLGLDATPKAAKGLLGFSIQRTDHTEQEKYWLKGFRTFEETMPDLVPGQHVSSYEHPIQGFMWGDYTAKPEHEYTFEVVPVYGKPKNLEHGEPVTVNISTEREDDGEHAVYFNRGAAGSQAYAIKFQNKPPDKVPGRRAFKWLSRGLESAMLSFIKRAKGNRYSLRMAVYEFNYRPVLKALKTASESGADIKIIYDSRIPKNYDPKENPRPVTASDKAIEEVGIRDLMIRRTNNPSYISHNKFIILLKDSQPIEVWTGSTNFTEGGIFGQSNVGHIIRNRKIAQSYLDYWQRLSKDPEAQALRKSNLKETPNPEGPVCQAANTPIFSPRPTTTALEWYGKCLEQAKGTICITAAFGVTHKLAQILAKKPNQLRYILLEKPGKTFYLYDKVKDNCIAIGAVVPNDCLLGWVKERLTGLNTHVCFLHTKYMLIDPLTDNPTLITGSANFSVASTKNNDENMVIIQGNTRVADLYLGEFMRLFNHFQFRDYLNRTMAKPGSKVRKSAYLAPDDRWTRKFYVRGSYHQKERLLFM
jgi:phosphatidylserine/phosphatidylglycerophosphate/cardiolipin synthase-like enzyme